MCEFCFDTRNTKIVTETSVYRIASNKRRGKKGNFTSNRGIMIYIRISLDISYVST